MRIDFRGQPSSMTLIRTHRINYPDVSAVAFASLWIFVFCVPWEEEVALAQGVAVSHLIGAAAAGAGILACMIHRRIRKLDRLHYVLGGLVLWSALTYCWSVAPDLSAVRAASCAQLLLMIWLIWEFAPNERRQLSLLQAYVLGTFVSASSIIYSFITGKGENLGLVEGRYSASGFNENEVGIILALSLSMSCYLLARSAGPRWLWLLHIPVCVLAICLTGSRGSFIASSVGLLMLPLSFASLSRAQRRLGILTLILLTAAAFVFVPLSTWQRLGTIRSEISEGTLTKRTYIWAAGLDVYRQHPIAGVGAGAFGASVYSKLDIPYVAHNSYLSVLVELGAVGAILFAALLAGLFRLAARLPTLESRAWTILLLTWAVAVSSVTWEHRKPTWFLFGLLIAQAAVLRRPFSVVHLGIPLHYHFE
jgi:O-antigen ligase